MSFLSTHGTPNLLWVGNIPYEAREEDLEQLLSTVGPVASVRISLDKESGQSKGFAFCEYEDPDCCALAVAKLNGTLFGGRTLRLDFSSNDQLKHDPRQHEAPPQLSLASLLSLNPSIDRHTLPKPPRSYDGPLSTVPSATALQDIHSARLEVCRFVQSLTAAQLLYILGHLQRLTVTSPHYARSLLRGTPTLGQAQASFLDALSCNLALCYAVLHAQFICGMIDEPFIATLSEPLIQNIDKDTQRRQAESLEYFYQSYAHQLEMESKHDRRQPLVGDKSPSCSSSCSSLSPVKRHSEQSGRAPHESFQTWPTLHGTPVGPKSQPSDAQPLPPQPQQQPVILSPPICTRPAAPPNPLVSSVPSVEPSVAPSAFSTAETDPFSAKGDILDELLAQPQLLEQLFSMTPQQEAQLSTQERHELDLVRQVSRLLDDEYTYPPVHLFQALRQRFPSLLPPTSSQKT